MRTLIAVALLLVLAWDTAAIAYLPTNRKLDGTVHSW